MWQWQPLDQFLESGDSLRSGHIDLVTWFKSNQYNPPNTHKEDSTLTHNISEGLVKLVCDDRIW